MDPESVIQNEMSERKINIEIIYIYVYIYICIFILMNQYSGRDRDTDVNNGFLDIAEERWGMN